MKLGPYRKLIMLERQANLRTDEYSASNPLHLIRRIVVAIRETLPADFVVGIKLNSGDYVDSAKEALQGTEAKVAEEQRQRALGHVKELASWGTIDFIEVSGGNYENPGMS
jgi:2,4-dienoyl-CoA reductase-like NADH-dependent reductase (Old Yellow Enzyme family)